MKQMHLICLLMIAAQNGFSTIEETLDYIYAVHCRGDIREWLQYKYHELFNLYQLESMLAHWEKSISTME